MNPNYKHNRSNREAVTETNRDGTMRVVTAAREVPTEIRNFYKMHGDQDTRACSGLKKGCLFGTDTMLPIIHNSVSRPLYDLRHPLNAYSISVGKPKGKGNDNHIPREWLKGIGEWMRKFCACGVASIEQGEEQWGTHLQIIACLHAPSDVSQVLDTIKMHLKTWYDIWKWEGFEVCVVECHEEGKHAFFYMMGDSPTLPPPYRELTLRYVELAVSRIRAQRPMVHLVRLCQSQCNT